MPAPQPGEMQRRHSSASSSDTASDHGMNSRHTSQENISIIPTRTTKVATSKPAANPLQFIKVGPCDLYRSAQEQLKKVEEVKKVKQEKRDEAEDWQSNLDNWKCSRRKRQEHIIERVVEVKKFELEEFDRNRRRSKTFSEMMEERNSKGRKMSLPVYKDDDNDLSELGLGGSKQTNGISVEDSVFEDVHKVSASEASSSRDTVKQNGTEEYTYESAIQSYVNFTESRVKSRLTEDTKSCNGFSKKPAPFIPAKPRRNSCKIEEKLSELEEIKKKSVSTTDLNNDTGKKSITVPKVDISKRRELFEKSTDEEQNSKINRLSNDFSSAKSIRERLSSLGKQNDETTSTKKLNCLPTEISVKDRLSNIEKNKCVEGSNKVLNRAPNEISQQSVKERLSSLQKETNTSSDKVTRNILPTDISSIQDRLCSLDAACNKEISRTIVVDQDIQTSKQEEIHVQNDKFKNGGFERALSPEEEVYENKQQQHYRHRSLDSLDVDSNDGLGNESFERVQSLEDFDFCRNYPASSMSNDTDREDSGIHTADVSSSVSQADDCDEDLKLHHPIVEPPIVEETKNEFNNLLVESEPQNQQSVSFSENGQPGEPMVMETTNFMKLPLRLELDPLPVILESPSEPYPAFEFTQFEHKDTVFSSQDLTVAQNLNETFTVDAEECIENNIAFSDSTNDFCDTIPNDPADSLPEAPPTLCKINHFEPENHDPLTALVPDSCKNVIADIPNISNTDSTVSNALDTSNNSVNAFDAVGSPLSISNVSMNVSDACMQDETAFSGAGDKRKTVVEICYKIDSNQLSSPLPTPFISVDTDFNFKPQEKPEDHLIMGDSLLIQSEKISPTDTTLNETTVNHFQAITLDVAKPEELNVAVGEKILSNSAENLMNKIEPAVDTSANKPNMLFINSDFNLNGDVVFPLSPATLEPPKEKPPPPPTEMSDEEDGTLNEKSSPLRRLDSTKRIKKEIRQKRSSFLGLNDGLDDDSYLEPELEVRPPPDMTTFLAEERRLEQMMYRQSICSESDSNQESRDSGVELEKHPDDLTWSRLHHSRDNSETFGNTSTTSEEDEIIKKEREIIEMLEQEELNRYKANSQNDQDNIGEKLAIRLRELEHEKSQIEWERREEAARRKADEIVRKEHESRIQVREQELRKKENVVGSTDLDEEPAYEHDKQLEMDILLSEREHLEKEQEALLRQRETMIQQQWSSSMQDIPSSTVPVTNYRHSLMSQSQVEYRQSMPDLANTQPRRPPPPIPPSKPLIVPRNEEKRISSSQQMSRQTIQALSAAPRSRLISSDNWMQTKRKTKVAPENNYNYQHWLIQEAEHRRITEQHQRQAPPPRRPALPQTVPRPANTPQYTNWQPPQQKPNHEHQQWSTSSHRPAPPQQHQKWAVPQPRSDKPLPDSIIQTLTQRVQNRINTSDPNNNRRRVEPPQQPTIVETRPQSGIENQEKMLSVSGKKKCSHCGEELGRGAAMIIESLRLFYHINCFKCCVCCVQLGDGLMGTDVRVRNNKLHCHNCYSSDDGVKFSCV